MPLRTINGRTERRLNLENEEFLKLLKQTGIPENSRDMGDYEEAKKWAGTVCDGPKDYERLIILVAEYVGI